MTTSRYNAPMMYSLRSLMVVAVVTLVCVVSGFAVVDCRRGYGRWLVG